MISLDLEKKPSRFPKDIWENRLMNQKEQIEEFDTAVFL